jgi:hypothetical protein
MAANFAKKRPRISEGAKSTMRTTLPLYETFLREAAGERVRACAHGALLGAVVTGRQVGLEAAEDEGEAMSCCNVSARGVEGAGHGLSSPRCPSLQKGECCWDCLPTGCARSPSTASDASGASTCLADHSGLSREGSPARKSSGTSDPAGLREAAPRVDVVDLTKCDADSDRGAPEMPDELQGETFSMNRGIMPRERKRGM